MVDHDIPGKRTVMNLATGEKVEEEMTWKMLPAPEGTCQICATAHPPELPHNQQSLFYQMRFYGKHRRWPTWDDAMAHCSDEMRKAWTDALRQRGAYE